GDLIAQPTRARSRVICILHPIRRHPPARYNPTVSTAVQRSGAAIAENTGPTGVPSAFATVEEAIEDVRAGRLVVVVDAADRENEGDLTIAAQFATPEVIAFMAKQGRGLICLCLSGERCDVLGLRQMTERNQAPHGTAFTVSIEARE